MMKMRKMGKTREMGPGASGSRFLPLGLAAGPIGGIATTVLRNWKVVLFCALLGLIVYQNSVQFEFLRPIGFRTIPGLEQDLTAEKEKNVECELSRENLKGAIEAQNSEIERWGELTESLRDDHTKLSGRLVELSKTGDAEVKIILDGPVPRTCDGAIKLLREAATKGQLKWEK